MITKLPTTSNNHLHGPEIKTTSINLGAVLGLQPSPVRLAPGSHSQWPSPDSHGALISHVPIMYLLCICPVSLQCIYCLLCIPIVTNYLSTSYVCSVPDDFAYSVFTVYLPL